MDKVTLDGKLYERSAVVAKRFGYTADYMGQLSRSKKVDARLIGRSWYVNSDSVQLYQESLDDDSVTPVDTSTEEVESYSVPVHVEKKKPVNDTQKVADLSNREDEMSNKKRVSRVDDTRNVHTPNTQPRDSTNADHVFRSYARWRHVAYKPDDGELLPKVKKPKQEKIATPDSASAQSVSNAETRHLNVHSDTDQFSILTGEVPAVQLRGRLNVVPLDDNEATDYSTEHVVARKKIADLNRSHTSFANKRSPQSSRGKSSVSNVAPKQSRDTRVSVPATASSARWYVHPAFWFAGIVILILLCAFLLLAVQVQVTYDAVSQTTTSAWTLRHPIVVLESLLALF